MPWQTQNRQFHLGPFPFTLVARLIGSLRVLPELADLGQLFKITHWHRKGGTRGNEVCPHTAQGAVLNLYKCRALTQRLQTKCLFQREPFTAVPGVAAGSSAQSSQQGPVPLALAAHPCQAGAVQAGPGPGPGGLPGERGTGRVSGKGRPAGSCSRQPGRPSELSTL